VPLAADVLCFTYMWNPDSICSAEFPRLMYALHERLKRDARHYSNFTDNEAELVEQELIPVLEKILTTIEETPESLPAKIDARLSLV